MISKIISAFKRLESLSKQDGKVLIFGANRNGEKLLNDLVLLGTKVNAFLDNDKNKWGKDFCGLPIMSINYIKELHHGSFFICCSFRDINHYQDARHQLESMGLIESNEFIDFGVDWDERFYKDGINFMDIPVNTYDLRYKMMKKTMHRLRKHMIPFIDDKAVVISSIDFKITTFCSFNCLHCSLATPFIEQKHHFDPRLIVNDLDKLLSVSYTPLVSIIGGEPLLHPQLPEIMERLSRMSNLSHCGSFMIITNGTVIPSEELIKSIKMLPLIFVVNDYARLEQKIGQLVQVLKDNNINYKLNFEGKKAWRDFGDHNKCRNYAVDELKHLYAICDVVCTTIYAGRFYACCRAGALAENNLVPCESSDFIDIRGSDIPSEDLQAQLYEYLYAKKYLSVCNYCDGSYIGSREVPVGG